MVVVRWLLLSTLVGGGGGGGDIISTLLRGNPCEDILRVTCFDGFYYKYRPFNEKKNWASLKIFGEKFAMKCYRKLRFEKCSLACNVRF